MSISLAFARLLKYPENLEMTFRVLFVCPPYNLQRANPAKKQEPKLYAFARKTTIFVATKARVFPH